MYGIGLYVLTLKLSCIFSERTGLTFEPSSNSAVNNALFNTTTYTASTWHGTDVEKKESCVCRDEG